MKNLVSRIITALILLPVVFFSFYYGGFFLKFLLLLVGLIASIEISLMVLSFTKKTHVYSLLLWLGILCPIIMFDDFAEILSCFCVLFMCLNMLFLFDKNSKSEIFEKFSLVFYFSLYVFIALASVCLLQSGSIIEDRNLGLSFIWCGFIATWFNDIFAYFGGRAFGKRPLFYLVSQKKTWEGFFCGSVGGLLAIPIIKYIGFFANMSIWDIIWVVVPSLALAPLGDLMESRLKRLYAVKDSSNILPGHGGILDRIDGLLLVLPWTLFYVIFIR